MNHQTLRACVLGALVLSMACIPQLGGTVPVSELRFLDKNSNVILDLVTPNEAVWPRSLLGLVPTTFPQGVDFISTAAAVDQVRFTKLLGAPMEAHLFTQDLDFIQSQFDAWLMSVVPLPTSQAREGEWDGITNPGLFSMDVVVPFPPNATWNLTTRYAVNPLQSAFFEPPASGGTAPIVSTVRILHPGLCAFEQAFTQSDNNGLFDVISDQFWTTIAGKLNAKGATAVRHFTRVTTRLDRRGSQPLGGFEFAFDIEGQSVLGGPEFVGAYDVAFTIASDGVFSAEVTSGDVNVNPPDATTHGDLNDAIVTGIPSALHDSAATKQHRNFALQCANGTDPQPAILFLQQQLTSPNVKALGLSNSQIAELSTTIGDPSNWDCNADNAFAEFQIKARRLVTYPDRVQLVWFDAVDTSDPNYALYVALVGLGQGSALCADQPTFVGSGFPSQVESFPFVTVKRESASQ